MNFNFDLQRFGGGGGHKSTGKLIGSIVFGAAAVAFQMFGTGVGAFARFAMGASLFSSVWTATHKPAVGSLDITRFDREQETMSSTAQIPVVYGMRKITGNQTFHDTNSDANTLHKHVVLCEGGIEGITSVCANDLLIPTGSQSTGTVFTLQNMKYTDATVRLSGKHLYLHANSVDHDIYLCNKDDTSGSYWSYQVSISGLISYLNRLNEGWQAFPLSTTNKYPGDLHGVGTTACYRSVVDFTADTVTGGTTYTFHDCEAPDNYETVGGYTDLAWLDMTFQVSDELNGNPSVDCIVKGKKVYDTRTKTTAYSTNPALCLRDFLLSPRYGLGKWFKDTDLDEDSWNESADYCDESVTFTNSDGSKETAKRYELNIVIDQQQSALQWLQTLLANFCGYIVYSNGKLKLCIEKPTVVSYKFNDDNCSDIKIEPLNLTETPNRYEVSLVDPLNNWATVKAICEDLADQKLRQHIVTKEVSLEGVTSQHQALRLARFYRDYNLVCPLQFSFTTGMQGMSLEPGDVVTVSYHGVFTDMPMRIAEIKETNKGTFEISGRQYNGTIYGDDLGGGIHWYNYSSTKDNTLIPSKPTHVKATTKYRTYSDGSTGYDVIVSYTLPSAYNVETGLVYYKLNHETGENIVFNEGVAADEAGYSNEWSYAGDSATSCTISGAKLGDTYRIKVITRNRGGYLSDDSDIVTVTVTEKATVPAQPQNLSYDFTDDFTFSWNDVADTDAVYYEVICGSTLLARTKYTTATVKLTERKATVYVYAVNSQGKRSYPAEIAYDVPKPIAPASITFTEIPIGVKITVSDFPSGCHEMHLKIDGNTLTLKNATYAYQGNAGIYDVSAAYVDLFGEGEWSQTFAMTVKATFKAEWIADESIGLAKVDATVNDALAKGKEAYEGVTNIVANLNGDGHEYSAITQLSDDINLRVVKGDVINQINLTAEGTTIDGKYLHVTGTTQFDNNVIVGGMIAAGSITADKLSASTIALSDNQGIQGGNVTLDSRGMTCIDSNGATIQFGQDGMVSKDKNGNNFAILSQCMMGVVKNGKYVKFNNPWTETPVVIITPQNVQTNNPAYSTSQVRLHCYAEDVSVNGFRVRAYSGIANGSGSFAQYQECGSMNWTIWRDLHSSQNMGLPYGSRSITFTVKMPSNASRVVFHGRFGMNVGYKYNNFVRFPNSASQNISIKCNGTEIYNGMFFSAPNNNEIHGPTSIYSVDEYCPYTSNAFTVAQGSDLTCTLTLNPWTEHDGDGSDDLKVWLIIDSLNVYVDGEQILDNDGTGAFFVVNRSNGLYTLQ